VRPRILVTGITILLAAAACDGGGEGGSDDGGDGSGGDREQGDREQIVTALTDHGSSPVEGVRIQIGDSDWAATDANGDAFLPAVSGPFTVRVRQTTETGRTVHETVWVLTEQTANPLVVRVDGSRISGLHRAAIEGKVLGADLTFDERLFLFAHDGTQEAQGGFDGGPTLATQNGDFHVRFGWEGEGSRMVEMEALRVDVTRLGPPVRYFSHGKATVSLNDPSGLGAVVFGVQMVLEPVENGFVAGAVTKPDGFEGYLRPMLHLQLKDGTRADHLVGDGTAFEPGSFEFAFPLLDGTTPIVGFHADALDQSGASTRAERSLDGPASGVGLELPPPVALLGPAPDEIIAPDTVFRWEERPGAARYALTAYCGNSEGNEPNEIVFPLIETRETQVTLPAIPGVDLSGFYCSWSVGWLNEGALTVRRNGGGAAPDLRESWSAWRSITIR
jgi:hypothetical protein